MSHPSRWRCRACGTALGEHDADGRLRPVPTAETLPVTEVAANGAAALRCPKCGEVRVRRPAGSPIAQFRR